VLSYDSRFTMNLYSHYYLLDLAPRGPRNTNTSFLVQLDVCISILPNATGFASASGAALFTTSVLAPLPVAAISVAVGSREKQDHNGSFGRGLSYNGCISSELVD
jgi:hypothetical protein